MTTYLQSIAENYNISKSIDFFSLPFERISRELCAFKETLEISLNSFKSCYKSQQKRTKSLDLSLANMSFEGEQSQPQTNPYADPEPAKPHRLFGVLEESGSTWDAESSGLSQKTSDP